MRPRERCSSAPRCSRKRRALRRRRSPERARLRDYRRSHARECLKLHDRRPVAARGGVAELLRNREYDAALENALWAPEIRRVRADAELLAPPVLLRECLDARAGHCVREHGHEKARRIRLALLERILSYDLRELIRRDHEHAAGDADLRRDLLLDLRRRLRVGEDPE